MRQGTTLRDSRRPGRMLFSVLLACAAVAHAEDDPVPRDPLELRALIDGVPALAWSALPNGGRRRLSPGRYRWHLLIAASVGFLGAPPAVAPSLL